MNFDSCVVAPYSSVVWLPVAWALHRSLLHASGDVGGVPLFVALAGCEEKNMLLFLWKCMTSRGIWDLGDVRKCR